MRKTLTTAAVAVGLVLAVPGAALASNAPHAQPVSDRACNQGTEHAWHMSGNGNGPMVTEWDDDCVTRPGHFQPHP